MFRPTLSVGVLDPSGCEGLWVDLRVYHVYRLYGVGVVTAIVARNTRDMQGVYPVPMEHVGAQLDAVLEDMRPAGVRVGAIPDLRAAELVAGVLEDAHIPVVVVDPVMASSGGLTFHTDETLRVWTQTMASVATVLTPNLQEASVLAEMSSIQDVPGMRQAAEAIAHKYDIPAVVVKGGRLAQTPQAVDVVYDGRKANVLEHPWTHRPNRLGVGDAFAALIVAMMAQGMSILQAVSNAKQHIARAMHHTFQLGSGPQQPLNLFIPRI